MPLALPFGDDMDRRVMYGKLVPFGQCKILLLSQVGNVHILILGWGDRAGTFILFKNNFVLT